jgi:hypothetical protein
MVINTTAGAGPSVSCIVPNAAAGGTVLVASMTGGQEPDGGDPDAFGFAKIVVNPQLSQICFRISVANIAPATASHIHQGGIGVEGPVVVPFVAPDAEGLVNGCVVVDPALAQAIIDNPSGYYVNVHNPDHPAGVVRGQLMPL